MEDSAKTKSQLIAELEEMRQRVTALEASKASDSWAEEALYEIINFSQSLLQTLPFGMDIVDEDGNILFLTHSMQAALGTDAIGKKCWQLYRDDKKQCDDCPLRTGIQLNETSILESQGVFGGKTFQITHTGMMYKGKKAVLEIFQDITEQKQVEHGLWESEEKFKTLAEESPNMIFINKMGRIIYANKRCEEIMGYSKEEFYAEDFDFMTLIAQESRDLVQKSYQKHLRGEHVPPYEYKIVTKAGEELTAIHTTTLIDFNGDRAILGIITDVTKRKKAEEALRESNHRLEEAIAKLKEAQQQIIQQERLRALGMMASGIAHNFNNALTPILGFSELLLDHRQNLDDKAKVERYLRMINTTARDTAAVVRRLREFYRSRGKNEVLQMLNLNTLVSQVIKLTRPRWKSEAEAKGVTINVKADLHDVPPISGNEGELRDALTNLIFNAVEAMPDGGEVTCRTKSDEGGVLLEISDTGVGMTEEVRQRCLDPFFSTKSERGAGMGLAIVFGVVHRHEGTLAIDSEPAMGTTVVIRFPAQVGQPVEETKPEVKAPIRPLRVLVVDDEILVREFITQFLIVEGHHVEDAANGREGLEKFRNSQFDVAVIDRAMPGMNGDELAVAIKGMEPEIPVILLTGFGDLMQSNGEKPEGVDIIMSKPVTLAELRGVLTKVV